MIHDFYPPKEQFPYRVIIDNEIEWRHHHEICKWCNDTFGEDSSLVKWRHCLAGSPSRADPEFSTWLFMDETDATLFRLTWG